MTIWVFQILLDLVLAIVAVQAILGRKKIRELERRLDSRSPSPSAHPGAVTSHAPATRSEPSVSVAALALSPDAPWIHASPPTEGSALVRAAASNLKNLSTQGAQSNLYERQVTKTLVNPKRPEARGSVESYDRAAQLLARGVDTREISRLTGLSLAELQLMGKVSSRTQ